MLVLLLIVMELILGIIVGILALGVLVIGHEFGHFCMARKNGVEVEEFGIGFPPRAIAWHKVDGKWKKIAKEDWEKVQGKGLVVSLNWLPIGGFCQMKGESAADKRKGTFGSASFWSKTKILFGGVTVNWLIAILVFTVVAWVGMPKMLPNQFSIKSDERVNVLMPVTLGTVVENSPAALSGLRTDDIITGGASEVCEGEEGPCSIDRWDFVSAQDLLDFNKAHAGEAVYYDIASKESDRERTVEVTLNGSDSEYLLGAEVMSDALYRSTWSAPIVGVGLTLQLTGETFKGVGVLIYDLVKGVITQFIPNHDVRTEGQAALKEAGDSVTGPVGIIGVLFPTFLRAGFSKFMYLVALISVSLAVMNVLPIPALDGGRWLLIAIY